MSSSHMNEIRNRIREQRLSMGYSFQELADLTKLSKSTLQRYETGDIGNLPLDKLEILATALQTTPQYLMGWETFEEASIRLSKDINRHLKELEPQWEKLKIRDESAFRLFAASCGFVVIKKGNGYILQWHRGTDNESDIPIVEEIHLTVDEYSKTQKEISQYTEYVLSKLFSE